MVMVAAHFPESAPVVRAELERAHPLGALPAVELRHHQPQRIAMVRLKLLAVMPVREHRVLGEKLVERQVARIVAVALDEDVAHPGLELHELHQVADLDALPLVVEPRPRRDAMEVGGLARFRQRTNLLVRQAQRLLDQTNHAKVPLLRIKTRSRPETQHRKTGNQILTGRKTPFQLFSRTRLRHGLINTEASSEGKEFGY